MISSMNLCMLWLGAEEEACSKNAGLPLFLFTLATQSLVVSLVPKFMSSLVWSATRTIEGYGLYISVGLSFKINWQRNT